MIHISSCWKFLGDFESDYRVAWSSPKKESGHWIYHLAGNFKEIVNLPTVLRDPVQNRKMNSYILSCWKFQGDSEFSVLHDLVQQRKVDSLYIILLEISRRFWICPPFCMIWSKKGKWIVYISSCCKFQGDSESAHCFVWSSPKKESVWFIYHLAVNCEEILNLPTILHDLVQKRKVDS